VDTFLGVSWSSFFERSVLFIYRVLLPEDESSSFLCGSFLNLDSTLLIL
ncbi:unnamed protein product, partial [Brassica oleracea var. botrytis]